MVVADRKGRRPRAVLLGNGSALTRALGGVHTLLMEITFSRAACKGASICGFGMSQKSTTGDLRSSGHAGTRRTPDGGAPPVNLQGPFSLSCSGGAADRHSLTMGLLERDQYARLLRGSRRVGHVLDKT